MNSNDIKWNKIKAIEKELSEYWWSIFNKPINNYKDANFVKQYADKETWILANKLYDIATKGSKPADNPYGYGSTALTTDKVIYHVNQLPLHIYADDLDYCITAKDFFWEMYDYLNS